MTDTLLPCPFCGDEVIRVLEKECTGDYYWVAVCQYCESSSAPYQDKSKAITAWNERTNSQNDESD